MKIEEDNRKKDRFGINSTEGLTFDFSEKEETKEKVNPAKDNDDTEK